MLQRTAHQQRHSPAEDPLTGRCLGSRLELHRAPIQAIPIRGSTSTKGINYRTITVPDDDDETRGLLRELGFMQFPVVWAPRVGYWAGFRPDKIDGIHKRAILPSDAT